MASAQMNAVSGAHLLTMVRDYKSFKLGFSKEEYTKLRQVAKANRITVKGLLYNGILTRIGQKGLMKIKLK